MQRDMLLEIGSFENLSGTLQMFQYHFLPNLEFL